MEKVFRIKDLDTGQEFLVDEAAADSMMGGGVVSASRGDGKSPRLVAPPPKFATYRRVAISPCASSKSPWASPR